MKKAEETIKAQTLPQTKKDIDNMKKNKVEDSVKTKTSLAIMLASVGLGLVGAIVGAIIWYAVAAVTNIKVGYLAILVGVLVGLGMKLLVKNANSLSLGLIAAVLSIIGLTLGNYLLWRFQMPKWTRDDLVENYGWTQEEASEVYPDEVLLEGYSFFEFMKDDLTSFEAGHNAVLEWLFYGFAIYYGFSRVFNVRDPNKSL